MIPHQRGFPAQGRVPELLLAVPTHRTWWQGLGYHHHHLPLPAGDQQTAVPSRAAPGPGAALPLGGTVSAGGSFLPQTDAAMSQSFPAGANKPLLHLCQVFVCPFHALLSPLKVIFPSIILFFFPRKKNSIIFPSSLPALYPNSPFLRRCQPKAVPQGELSQRRLRRIPPPPSFTPSLDIPTTLSFILDSPAQHQPFLIAHAFPSSTTPSIFSFFFAICALENSFPPPPAPLLGGPDAPYGAVTLWGWKHQPQDAPLSP